jgi:hypothetical protein
LLGGGLNCHAQAWLRVSIKIVLPPAALDFDAGADGGI